MERFAATFPTLLLATFLTLLLAGMLSAQSGLDSIKQVRQIDMLAWLNGGVWTADAALLGPGMVRIETRYAWSDNQAFLRFNTHFVMDKGVLKNYDGQFFWDREQNALEIWYMDASNAITHGPVRIEGNEMQITFHGPDFAGQPADLRVKVTRRTADHYTWRLEERGEAGWKQLAQLEYLRTN